MKWLLENRTDFGPNGWDKLLGEENCSMVQVVGNHFTMMKPPVVSAKRHSCFQSSANKHVQAKGVGQFIRESLN
jgi:hypothetical protein